ncbi:MAG: uncharacterized protein JWP36_325 [Paucimonas sp.]|nr:uncharacterized protein [Paucimonas sp.]
MNENNTARSFRDKWENNQSLAFSATLDEGHEINKWILERNGFAGMAALRSYLAGKTRILDAGCGNGRVTALLRSCSSTATTEVVGMDLVASEVARKNLAGLDKVAIHAGDLLEDLSFLGQFDFIYCQEVLHHTSDPKQAFLNLASRLLPGGEIAIYVYKQKAPVREFTDDYNRERIKDMPYDEALAVCAQITSFGCALAKTQIKVTVPAVDVLDIPAGEYDVQRLLYHFFMKCFWNPQLDFEENNAINYDWYHPMLCSRHTLGEVLEWFEQAGLEVRHQHVDYYGITVRGKSGAVNAR